MPLPRMLRHLLTPDWVVRRAFPEATLQAIEAAIGGSERGHRGELRFAVEAGLPFALLWRGATARERAVELFSLLRVWDTEENSGVLIYVQLVDHRVELLADRGVDAKVGQAAWEAICRRLEEAYRRGDFRVGTLAAVEEVGALLCRHFPAGAANPNELPDRPVRL